MQATTITVLYERKLSSDLNSTGGHYMPCA